MGNSCTVDGFAKLQVDFLIYNFFPPAKWSSEKQCYIVSRETALALRIKCKVTEYRNSVITKRITTYCFRIINPYELLTFKGHLIHFHLLSAQFLSPSVLTTRAGVEYWGLPVHTHTHMGPNRNLRMKIAHIYDMHC